MEREMRVLGLSPRTKKLTTTTNTLTSILPSTKYRNLNETSFNENETSFNSSRINSNDTTKVELIIDDSNMKKPVENNNNNNIDEFVFKSNDEKDLDTSNNSGSSDSKSIKQPRLNNSYYARRLSTIGLMTQKDNNNNEPQIDFKKCKRKFSLDNSRLLPSNMHAASFIKSLRQSNLLLIDNNGYIEPSIEDGDANKTLSISKLDNSMNIDANECNQVGPIEIPNTPYPFSPYKTDSDILKPSTNQSARTTHSMRTPFSYKSARTNFTNLSNISNMSETNIPSSIVRRNSLPANSPFQLPKIMRSSNRNLSGKTNDDKRRVSFGQIELTQLEIPTVYKYSNIGYERYKLNPHFYLPDGSLKRKFSLPRLSDTLDSVKNCRYLRRFSMDAQEDNIDVKNIFKDLQPSPSELKNFDILPYTPNE